MQRKMALLGLGLVLVSLALFHGVCTKSVVENVAVEYNLDGTFTVYLPGDIWFRRSGAVGVRADGSSLASQPYFSLFFGGSWWATDEKTLEVIGQTTNQGNDTIGEFTSYEYTWKAVSNASAFDLQVNTYINVYTDVPVHGCVCDRLHYCSKQHRHPRGLQPNCLQFPLLYNRGDPSKKRIHDLGRKQ